MEGDVLAPAHGGLRDVHGRGVVVDPDDLTRRVGEDLRPVARPAAEVEDAQARHEPARELVAVTVLGGEERVVARRLERQALDDVRATSLSRTRASISALIRSRLAMTISFVMESGRTR